MRFRLVPTPAQEGALLEHCAHARFVWNLACEQHQHWRPGRPSAPGYNEQSRQLTEARKEFGWDVRRLSRKTGEVWIPKVGWVQFRWSRQIPGGVGSFRVNRDRAGRWHVAFAAIPTPVAGPGTGEIVGVDRGVTVSAALSSGELLSVPSLPVSEAERLRRLRRKLARAQRGSNRRSRVKAAIGRLTARQSDRRRDWVEKVSTDLAHRFDLIRVEDLKIRNMVRSARGTTAAPGRNVRAKTGLNRSIHAAGWGSLVRRLEGKAAGRVERIDPAFTSQTCHICGHRAAENRESQAVFRCRACGHSDHADVNAAKNIAAGHAVTARGALQPSGGAANREPQPVLTSI